MKREPPIPGAGGAVLAVDDQLENRELLEELLNAAGFSVTTAADGQAALDAVRRDPPDCIVLDIMMPRMDGYQVCQRLKADPSTCFIPVIVLTALTDVADKVKGLELGADDFLNKPVRREELLARVRSLIRIKRLRDALDTSESIIFTMVRALESKDPRSAGHSERVAAASLAVAQRLGLSAHDREAAGKGGMLHDIGMLGIPEAVLLAPRPYPAEAEALHRQHAELGERILLPLRTLVSCREVVRHHHERLDGSGYPDGLYGRQVPTVSEIVGIANEYDNLVHVQGLAGEQAAAALRQAIAAGWFHADLVETFLEVGVPALGAGGLRGRELWGQIVPIAEISRTGTIVVGDDLPANREMYLEILGEAGFRLICVEDGQAVLDAVAEEQPDLVITDVRMPKLDGFTVCERIKADPDTEFLPVIVVTAAHDAEGRARASRAAADDFLPLPPNRLELLARVRSLLRLRMYYRDLEEHQNVVLSLASIIEAKDPYTKGHSARVGNLAGRLGHELGLAEEECERLRIAGLLHDIGKVGIPESLINKPGRLTDAEFDRVRGHPVGGERLCRPLKSLRPLLPLIRHHHEQYDGRGYPDGLAGEQIPLGARVLSLSDAYDALTSERAYRKSHPPEEALALLAGETQAGRWDPRIYAALAEVIRTPASR